MIRISRMNSRIEFSKINSWALKSKPSTNIGARKLDFRTYCWKERKLERFKLKSLHRSWKAIYHLNALVPTSGKSFQHLWKLSNCCFHLHVCFVTSLISLMNPIRQKYLDGQQKDFLFWIIQMFYPDNLTRIIEFY